MQAGGSGKPSGRSDSQPTMSDKRKNAVSRAGARRFQRLARRTVHAANEINIVHIPGGMKVLARCSTPRPAVPGRFRRIRRVSTAIDGKPAPETADARIEKTVSQDSGFDPDNWGIFEDPLLPIGDWEPEKKVGQNPEPVDRSSAESGEKGLEKPGAGNFAPPRVRTQTVGSSAMLQMLSDRGDPGDDSTTPVAPRPQPAPRTTSVVSTLPPKETEVKIAETDALPPRKTAAAPNRSRAGSGGVVGFLSRIFKT